LQREDCMVHCPDGDALICCLRDSIIGRTLPVFVLLDLRMPKKCGFEALRWIRLMPAIKTLPVVILSSSALPEDIDLAMSLGATSYIVKPGSYTELCRIVAELLARFAITGPEPTA